MFIDTCALRCYYMSVRLCTGGVRVPLNELASSSRCAGLNSVLRKIDRGEALKVFLADDADEKLASKVRAEDSQQLGRACALTRKTAVAAILKK